MKLYQKLANLVIARENCIKSKNEIWQWKHEETIEKLCATYMPSGSGFDDDTTLNVFKSKPNCLRLESAYHPLNENGFYENWINFAVIIKPSLAFGYDIIFQGLTKRQKEEYSDYFHSMFHDSLDEEIEG